MKLLFCALTVFVSFLTVSVTAEAVKVSTDKIEDIYVEALENSLGQKSYIQVGAPWESDGVTTGKALVAGLDIVEEPKILFVHDDSLEFDSEIAFEEVPKKENFKLSPTDVSEINDTLIFSQIKARQIDPKEFDVAK